MVEKVGKQTNRSESVTGVLWLGVRKEWLRRSTGRMGNIEEVLDHGHNLP